MSGDLPDTGEHPAVTDDDQPSALVRHDAIVVAVALVLLVLGSAMYRSLSAVKLVPLAVHGLSMQRPAGLLPPLEVEVPGSALGALAPTGDGEAPDAPADDGEGLPYHKLYKSPDGALLGLEISVDDKPDYRGLTMWLQLSRQTRYGEYHWTAASSEVTVDGRAWQRAEFQYAVKATEDDAPQVATGIEYATVNDGRLYVVTVHGTQAEARQWEDLVLSTLELK